MYIHEFFSENNMATLVAFATVHEKIKWHFLRNYGADFNEFSYLAFYMIVIQNLAKKVMIRNPR